MNDRTKKPEAAKPAGPDKSEAGVATTLAACGLKTDRISASISASIIADNIEDGRKGAAIIGGARVPENVGKCVADAYDTDKKPGVGDKLAAWADRIMNNFSDAAAGVSAAVSELAIKPGQGPTTVTIHNNTKPPEQRL